MTSIALQPGALKNKVDPIKLGVLSDFRDPKIDTLTQALNFDRDNEGLLTVRGGRTSRYTGTPHSWWTDPRNDSFGYFVEESLLKRLNSDYTATTIATLGVNLPLAYEPINDQLVVTNGVNIGWLDQETFTEFAPALSQFEKKTPAGQYLAFYNGTLYIANGSTIIATKPWNAERTDERYNTFPMNGYIRMLAAVEDGLWVATDREAGFITGGGPEEFQYVFKTKHTPPDGAFSTDTEETAGAVSKVVRWVSKEGFCEGRSGGAYSNLSVGDVALPTGTSGACFHRNNNGTNQTVAVIRNPEGADDFTGPTLTINSITVS